MHPFSNPMHQLKRSGINEAFVYKKAFGCDTWILEETDQQEPKGADVCGNTDLKSEGRDRLGKQEISDVSWQSSSSRSSSKFTELSSLRTRSSPKTGI